MTASLPYVTAAPTLTQLAATQFFNVGEAQSGAIFAGDGARLLQVSTDDGVTFNAVPGASSFLVGTDALAMNSLDECLVGTIATTPTIYYCTPSGVTQATGVVGAQTRMTRITSDASGVIYALNGNSAVFFRSTDHGRTWTALSASLPTPMGQAYTIEADAYGLLMGGEIGDCCRSVDGGVNWTSFGLSRPTYHGNLWVIMTDPGSGNVLATVGEPGSGPSSIQYHRPTDADGVWNAASGTAFDQVLSLVVQANGSILAGSNLSGTGKIYKSVNGGVTWTNISSRFPAFTGAVRLYIGPSGRLYITANNGMWRAVGQY